MFIVGFISRCFFATVFQVYIFVAISQTKGEKVKIEKYITFLDFSLTTFSEQ